jgi:hypothetical protein
MKILLFILLTSNIFAGSIELKNKKIIENVQVKSNTVQEVEYIDEDGKIHRLDKNAVLTVNDDSNKPLPPKIIITQMFGNESAFQGVSLFGDRLARRNGDSYKSVSEAYNVMTFVTFAGLPKGFEMDIAAANPLTARTNTDRDGFFQNTSGGVSQNQTVINSYNGGNLLFDPNATKIRDEKNKLPDYFFTRFQYNHETKFGTFGLGAVTINMSDPSYNMRLLYNVYWKAPFLAYLNPNINIYSYMLNEASGMFQGTRNIRLNLFHKYEINKDFYITPSVTVGYLDANNNINREKGIGDISTSLKFGYLSYFLNLNYVRRSETAFDNNIFFPAQGIYAGTNGDGMVADPSRINGFSNNFVTNQILANVSDENLRKYLINNYQNQKINRDIFFLQFGYTLKF